MKEFEELEQQLEIDINDLDTELKFHVDNYYDVSRGFRHAMDERDAIKKELAEEKSRAFFDARADLLADNGKATEAMINSKVDLDDVVKLRQQELLDAQSELNMWSALKDSYEQRAYALNKLVDLYVSGYFSTVPAESAATKSAEAKDRQQSDKYKKAKTKAKRKRKSISEK